MQTQNIKNKMVQQKVNFLTSLFQKKGQTKSYLFMLISSCCWVYGYVYANEHNFTPVETNLSRSIVMVVGSYLICRLMGLNIEFKSAQSWNTLLKRHASFILQGFVMAGVQFILPLGVTHTICSAGPILTLIMQRILHKNHQGSITGRKLQGCFIAVIGIILTSNGKYIYGYIDEDFEFTSSFQNYVSQSYGVIIAASLVLIVTMLIWSYGVLITQQAQCHAFEIVFHFAVMNLLFSACAYILVPDKRPAAQMYESLLWIGVFLFIAQMSFTSGLNLSENIGLTNVTAFMVVVVGYGISTFRYHQTVDVISLIGTILVLTGVSFVILTKQSKSQLSEDKSSQLNQILNKQDTIKQNLQKS